MTYSASEILDRTLFAVKPTIMYADSLLTQKVKTVPAGGTVGIVYSWISVDYGPYAGNIIWVIKEGNNTFYVLHEKGKLKPSKLAKTIDEIKEERDKKNKTTEDKIIGGLKTLAITGIAVFSLASVVNNFVSEKIREKE